MNVKKTDVVIIGSGLAGLMTADYLCGRKDVMLITKSSLNNSNSSLAQGGIAAAVTKEDDWHDHYHDTMFAGSFHNRKDTTEILVKAGSSLIHRLIEMGVSFDKDKNNEFSLGIEGAHRKRRIFHVGGDATGKAIVETVLSSVIEKIEIAERVMAFDLHVEDDVCHGVYTKDEKGNICFVKAKHVIMATGGVGQLYSATSNCEEATGDGIAMAYRAGVELVDMEFIQFHPTLLKNGASHCGLISEAVRGEGAKLVTENGDLLMKGKHPMEDLAPRDVVAREIFHAKLNKKNVYLNISDVMNFQERFPSIYKMCQKDPTLLKERLLPVEPGAHFIMGGIKVDRDGRSSIQNLYAVGECAYTGVHGANRLASNSLLEAVVFSERLSKTILNNQKENIVIRTEPRIINSQEVLQLPTREEIQEVMDKYVGIIRNKKGLEKALQWFRPYENTIRQSHFYLTVQEKTICNMLTVGLLITKASFMRNESRGSHFRDDFPEKNDSEWFGYRNVYRHGKLYCELFTEEDTSWIGEFPKVKKELFIS